MTRVHVATPNAKDMSQAVEEAFASFGAPVLGGPSDDGWSKQRDQQRCPRRFQLMHELGVTVPGETPSQLQIGILYHAVLACHYHRFLPEGYPGWHPKTPQPDALLDAVEAVGAEFLYIEQVRRLYWGYVEQWGNDIEPVAIEYPAGVSGIHTCRYDLVGWYGGELWIIEHKTASRETQDLMDAWYLDGEVLGEMYGWRLSGLEEVFGRLVGVCINIAFKEHPPRYRRLKVVIPEVVIQQYIRDTAHLKAERVMFRSNGYWPRRLNGCLGRYNDMCGYFSMCREGDDLVQIVKGGNQWPPR